jgi:hypothetical protein
MMPHEVIDVPAYILLTILGLAISFWGKQLARILSSIAFGAFLAYVTWFYTYSLWRSIALSTAFMLVAMIIGLFTGFLVFRLAVSMIFAYIVAGLITPGRETALFIILFILFTVIMYVLSKHILSLLFALTGSMMVFKGLTTLGLNILLAIIICGVIFTLGYYNQVKHRL